MTLMALTMVLVACRATSLTSKTIGMEVTTDIIISTTHGILHGTTTFTHGTLMVITLLVITMDVALGGMAMEVMETHPIISIHLLYILQTQLTDIVKV